LEGHLDMIEDRLGPRTRVLIIRVKRARNPDAVGTHLLDGFVRRVRERGVHVLLCGVRDELHRVFERTGLVALIGPDHVFREEPVRQTSTARAVAYGRQLLEAHPAGVECP
jgi:SulP family sulfate permease